MAYSRDRFTENAAGMTGRASLAMYDATGTTAQGGDLIATIRADNFFTGQEVKDACEVAAKGDRRDPATGLITNLAIAEGGGLKMLVFANDTTAVETFYLDATDNEVKCIGNTHAAFRIDGT